MASFNKVILLGNIVSDPQMRFLPNNQPVLELRLACNRRFKDSQGQDREEAMFIDCTSFGKQAEIINQYCQKGAMLFIEGRLKYDTWEDKQGGGKRSKHRIVIENFQLMPRRDGSGGGGGAPAVDEGGEPVQRRAPMARPALQRPMPGRPAPQQPAPAQDEAPFDDTQQFKDDDIPF